MRLRAPATEEEVRRIEQRFCITLPAEYLAFIRWSNGSEGRFGKAYLAILSAADVIAATEGYCLEQLSPGLVLVATDLGGTGYAFDARISPMPIREFQLIGDLDVDRCKIRGRDFFEFLSRLHAEG